jgi:nucleoside-diphosphate-sugar epimerase
MTVLVTGGGGFLGGAIVRRLLARGDAVVSFTRTAYPWLDELGVIQKHGDLTDLSALTAAAQGCEAMVHAAAKAGIWGRHRDFHATNVIGTENAIAACKAAGVQKLVYTSTPSVVNNGTDIEGGDESLPYSTTFEADYPRTKAEAERKVKAANGADLATVSLRPHLIWGPGDPHLIPRLLARARSGRLRRIGRREIVVDATYIDNAADAHLLALDRLNINSPIAGKAYFISNDEPVKMWDFLNGILKEAGIEPVTRSVPVWLARTIGRFAESFHRLFRLAGEPAMTRFLATQLGTSHWFNIDAAKRDLDYRPSVSMADGVKRLAASFTAS